MAEDTNTSSAESANASADQPAGGTGEQAQKKEVQQPQLNDAGTTQSGESQQNKTSGKYAGLDLNKIPESARTEVQAWAEKRERDQLRYITQKSQEIADVQNKAKYYDEYIKSPEYAEFKTWHSSRRNMQQTSSSEATPSASDFAAAGFSSEESSAIASAVERAVARAVQQKEQQFSQQLGHIQQETQHTRAQQELENLARLHPDVYDMADAGLLKPFVDHYCARQGQPLEVAYQKCKESMDTLQKQGQQILKKRVEEKKEGVTATPSPTEGDKNVVYVEPGKTREQTQQRINDAAFAAALRGEKVRVRVKRS